MNSSVLNELYLFFVFSTFEALNAVSRCRFDFGNYAGFSVHFIKVKNSLSIEMMLHALILAEILYRK